MCEMKNPQLIISEIPLKITDFQSYLRTRTDVIIKPESIERVHKSRQVIEQIIGSKRAVYGVNTGFGNFAEVRIGADAVAELQKRLVLSHAAGVGEPIPPPVVRLMMLLKIKSLSCGYSGCRFEIIETLCQLLNKDVLPFIPQQGSVGASGDLAPLAHMALLMIGQGKAFIPKEAHQQESAYEEVPASQALKFAGLEPLTLQAKEGLAILNGTQGMTAYALFTLLKVKNLLKVADITGSMSLEALLGTLTPFDRRIQELRNHPGQSITAENIVRLLHDSPIVASHRYSDHKVQDAYSLRCIPQVHGAVRDAVQYVESVLLHEANGVTDNPLVFPEENDVLSGGNFHGAPVAQVSDFMSIALTDLSSLAERRIEHMLDPSVSQLPAFLTEEGGLNSGFMIAHVTSAALVSENKVLAHPASIDSIPTSANKEDHVSMGFHAARKAYQIALNLENILAIELLCASQALDLRKPLVPAPATGAVLKLIREQIPQWTEDRLMHNDILTAQAIIHSGAIIRLVENTCGALN
jgi:histidine ammonia-lyase